MQKERHPTAAENPRFFSFWRLGSHHADCNDLLIGLRGFTSNGSWSSQVLNAETIVLPNHIGDDVPEQARDDLYSHK